jgi:hypothetical protein
MDAPNPTPSRLWKQMAGEQRLKVARAFWSADDAVDDQVQAALLIARQKKFRPKTVIALDLDRKARHLASLPVVPDTVAARALIVYHLAEQRPLMGAFLDALGIAHTDGLIEDDEVKPDPGKIPGAVAAVQGRFPAEDVALYLQTLVSQDAATWGALRDAIPITV